MKLVKLTLTLATLGLAVASAASHYTVKIDTPVYAGTTQLKPGEYRLELNGDKAVFTSGKTVVEVPATLGKAEKKFSQTSYQAIDSKIKEIDLGGTTTTVTFGSAAGSGATGGK